MRVLHVTPSFYPAFIYGGPIVSLYNLCLGLSRDGCDVRVLTTNANGRARVLDVQTNVDITIAHRLRVRYCSRVGPEAFSFQLARSVFFYVRWAEVVHLTGVYSFPSIPTLLACKIFRKPLIWSPRGSLQRWAGSRRLRLKAAWETGCRILAPSQLVLHVTSPQEAIESGPCFPFAAIANIPNGVELRNIVSRTEEDGTLRLLYLGRVDPKKGLENLLAACKILNDARRDHWCLTIAGSGEPSYVCSIADQIRRLDLQTKVRMLGDVQADAKEAVFEKASVLILPSYTENFGIVVAEALAHGVPVIASRGTPWRRLEEMGCGLWVENDSLSLAAAIRRIASMSLGDMGARGRRWMQKEYSWESVTAKFRELYTQPTRPAISNNRGLVSDPHAF